MITDNLSGAKGNNQSSAIIWLSLDPSLSLSGASWHHSIANPPGISASPAVANHIGSPSPHFLHLQHQSRRLRVILFPVIIHYRYLLLFLLLCRIITLLISFCIMFIAILWSIAILCIVVHCLNCITIVWMSGAMK